MKIYKKMFIVTAIFTVGSLALTTLLQFNNKNNQYSFLINILIGIFASSLLLFTNSLVGYFVEKRQFINELKMKTNSLRLMIKKVVVDYTTLKDGRNEVDVVIDEKLKKHIFEIAPYSFDIIEHLKKLPKKTTIKELDTETLEELCKDINTWAECICEMQVNKNIKVKELHIEDIFNPLKINKILNIEEEKIKKEYIAWEN